MIVVVASRITSMLHKDFIIRPFLCLTTGHVSFSLLGNDVRDSCFLGLEVITDSFRIIRSIPLFEYRFAFFHSGGVFDAIGMNSTAVQVHRNDFGSQFDILISDLSATVKRSRPAQSKYGGVVRFIYNRCIKRLLLLNGCDGINAYRNRIRLQRIFPLQGVLLCSIGGNHSSSSTLRRSLIGKHQ